MEGMSSHQSSGVPSSDTSDRQEDNESDAAIEPFTGEQVEGLSLSDSYVSSGEVEVPGREMRAFLESVENLTHEYTSENYEKFRVHIPAGYRDNFEIVQQLLDTRDLEEGDLEWRLEIEAPEETGLKSFLRSIFGKEGLKARYTARTAFPDSSVGYDEFVEETGSEIDYLAAPNMIEERGYLEIQGRMELSREEIEQVYSGAVRKLAQGRS